MTTTASSTRIGHRDTWTGTGALVRLRLRTHRWALIGWPLVIAGLAASTAFGVRGIYGTETARAAYAATVGESTISIALNGRGFDLTTLGGISVYEMGFYTLLILPAIALHMAIRLTRAEEESGRDELLTATRVGRFAPLAAGALTVAGAIIVADALALAGMTIAGLPVAGCVRSSLGLTVALLAWAAGGLVAAQMSRSARGAMGLGLGSLGVLYLARAVVDGRRVDATWANPSGWLAELRPFGHWRAWPLVAYGLLTIVLVIGAVALRTRRDLGSGLLAERSGPARARPWLLTPMGLGWRLSRGPLAGWAIGTAVWGGVIGLFAPEMRSMLAANPQLARYLGGSAADGVDLLVSMSALLGALMAAAFGVQMITRLGSDEMVARTGLVLSTRVSRLRWFGAELAIALLGTAAVTMIGGLATDVAIAASGAPATVSTSAAAGTRAALAIAPGALLVVAIAALAWAVAPRLGSTGWALVGWASVVGLLGDTLHLPDWSRGLSPLWYSGRVPIEPVSATATMALGAAVVGVAAAGAVRFRRRDLAAG